MIRLHVPNFSTLEGSNPKGTCVYGNVCEIPDIGRFTLSMYPCGVARLREDDHYISLYLRCLSLARGSMRSVQIDASFRVVKPDGSIHLVKSFSHLAWLSPGRVQNSPTSHPESGWEKFAKKMGERGLSPDFDSFTIEADLVVKAVAKEPGVSDQGELSMWSSEPDELISRLISKLKLMKVGGNVADSQGGAGAGSPRGDPVRIYSVDELCELSYESLLELQDNLNAAILRTREKEIKCSVCLDRPKDSACVPCGHRLCSQCIKQLQSCPECRQDIRESLRCY